MNRGEATRVSRGRRQVRFDDLAQKPVAPICEDGIRTLGPLRFEHAFADGRRYRADLSSCPLPSIVRTLSAALFVLLKEPAGPNSPAAAKKLVMTMRSFTLWLNTRDEVLRDASALEGHHIDAFESHLREKFRSGGQEPYQRTLRIVMLLRKVHQHGIARLRDSLCERLRYVANGDVGTTRPLNAYSDFVVDQLRSACRREIQRIVGRFTTEADALVARGRAPRLAGWNHQPNLLWEIAMRGPISGATLREHIGAGMVTRMGIRKLHQTLYPTQRDLVPFFVLLCLEMDIEAECLRELRSDCTKNATGRWATVQWCKRRAKGHEWKEARVRDGGSSTPGGLIRMVLTITRRARMQFPSERLWIALNSSALCLHDARFIRQPSAVGDAFDQFVVENGLLGDEGEPLNLDDLRRLRKSYKAERYIASGGQLESFRGHTRGVAATHYADIPALRNAHESAIEEGARDALVCAAWKSTILPSEAEEQLRRDAAEAARSLGVPLSVAEKLLDGQLDTFIAACRDFFDSPYGTPGVACPSSFWGCLDCENAVITSRKLPNILKLFGHIVDQREALPENEWSLKWGRAYLAIHEAVLPRFPPAVVCEAKSIAESGGETIYLPPELMGY